ncbi:MAG: hypothetical protein ABEJ67_02565 [Halanaeroarchaeum sp.]
MAVSHYAEEYGDDYRASLAAEFNPELAAALTDAPRLPPVVKDQLLDATRRAMEARETFLSELQREETALHIASQALREIDDEISAVESRPYFECDADELTRLEEDLTALAARCEELTTERQSGELHSVSRLFTAPHRVSLNEYLYERADCPYPLLTEVARLSTRVETARRSVRTAQRSHLV